MYSSIYSMQRIQPSSPTKTKEEPCLYSGRAEGKIHGVSHLVRVDRVSSQVAVLFSGQDNKSQKIATDASERQSVANDEVCV